MARVNCDVESCSYNTNNQCFAGQILISEQGISDNSTCCGAYLNQEAYANLAEYTTAQQPIETVKCKVGNCRHYENDHCTLQSVQITGEPQTHLYIQTHCNSFESR